MPTLFACAGPCRLPFEWPDLNKEGLCSHCEARSCERCGKINNDVRPVEDYDPTGPGTSVERRCLECNPE